MKKSKGNPLDQDDIRTYPYDQYVSYVRRSYTGNMPFSALAAKFEMTDTGDDVDHAYQDFSRNLLTDRTNIGQSKFDYEQPWDSQPSGIMGLHYDGHRGEVDIAENYMPDLCLYELTPDERGAATDPDFRKSATQSAARMGFVRLYNDTSPFTTSGERSERRVIADNLKGREWYRRVLKVFSPQLTNLVPGGWAARKHPEWVKHACEDRQCTDTNGSLVGGSKVILSDAVAFALKHADDSIQQEFAIMDYNRFGKQVRKAGSQPHEEGEQDGADSNLTLAHTTLALAMDTICKSDVNTEGEFGESTKQSPGKQPVPVEQKSLLQFAVDQATREDSIAVILAKNKSQSDPVSKVKLTASNQQMADTITMIAMAGANSREDVSKLASKVLQDVDHGDNISTVIRGLARTKAVDPSKLSHSMEVIMTADTMPTKNYKSGKRHRGRLANENHRVKLEGDSDLSAVYATNHRMPKMKTTRDEPDAISHQLTGEYTELRDNLWVTRSFDQMPTVKKYRAERFRWEDNDGPM